MNTKIKNGKSGGIGLGETKKKSQEKNEKEEPENWKENISFPNFPNTSGPAESNSICVNV